MSIDGHGPINGSGVVRTSKVQATGPKDGETSAPQTDSEVLHVVRCGG